MAHTACLGHVPSVLQDASCGISELIISPVVTKLAPDRTLCYHSQCTITETSVHGAIKVLNNWLFHVVSGKLTRSRIAASSRCALASSAHLLDAAMSDRVIREIDRQTASQVLRGIRPVRRHRADTDAEPRTNAHVRCPSAHSARIRAMLRAPPSEMSYGASLLRVLHKQA